jgi:hypothetical protein
LRLLPPALGNARVAAAAATNTDEKGNTMNDNTRRIAELHDLCRKVMGVAGKLMMTTGPGHLIGSFSAKSSNIS